MPVLEYSLEPGSGLKKGFELLIYKPEGFNLVKICDYLGKKGYEIEWHQIGLLIKAKKRLSSDPSFEMFEQVEVLMGALGRFLDVPVCLRFLPRFS